MMWADGGSRRRAIFIRGRLTPTISGLLLSLSATSTSAPKVSAQTGLPVFRHTHILGKRLLAGFFALHRVSVSLSLVLNGLGLSPRSCTCSMTQPLSLSVLGPTSSSAAPPPPSSPSSTPTQPTTS